MARMAQAAQVIRPVLAAIALVNDMVNINTRYYLAAYSVDAIRICADWIARQNPKAQHAPSRAIAALMCVRSIVLTLARWLMLSTMLATGHQRRAAWCSAWSHGSCRHVTLASI